MNRLNEIEPSNDLKLTTSERVPEGRPSGSVPLLLDELRVTGSAHSNSGDTQENRGALQPLPDAVASSGCREGHWDSTAAVCLSTLSSSVPFILLVLTSSYHMVMTTFLSSPGR